MKHTPGPWQAPFSSYVIGGGTKICQLKGVYIDNPNRDADARLIASAPDLLDVLERVVEYYDPTIMYEKPDWYEIAEQAIAKAKS